MHIRIPYTFNVNAVLPGKRNPTPHINGAYLNTVLNEVDEIDAPLATEWTNQNGETFQTRWYEGSHWISYKEYDEDKNYQLMTTKHLIDKFNTGNRNYNPAIPNNVGHNLKEFIDNEIPAFTPSLYRSIISNEQEAAIKSIENSISNFIIVDDLIWVKSLEPYYMYDRLKANRYKDGAIEFMPEIKFYDPTSQLSRHNEIFDAMKFKEFADYATDNGIDDRITAPSQFMITVFLPESIKFDSTEVAMFESTENFLYTSGSKLMNQPTDFIREWANLSDIFKDMKENKREKDCYLLIENLESMIEKIDPEKLTTYYDFQQIKSIIERYKSQPIDIDFDLNNLKF